MNKLLARAAILPIAIFLTAAGGYTISPSHNRILPVLVDPIEPGTELTVKRGEVFYHRPVGLAYSAVLGDDLKITIAGQTATLAKGMQLNTAHRVGGDAAGQLDKLATVYCTELKHDAGKGLVDLMTLGLASAAHRVRLDSQFCLVDNDGDGKVEQAFLVGAKSEGDLKPIDIPPTTITLARDVPLPGESEARIRFAGVAGIMGRIAFDLDVVEDGKRLNYSNGRSLLDKTKLPHEVSMFGAAFTVLAYNPDTNEARIRWERGFRPVEYGITTTTSTTYIPIFIHR